MGTPPSGASLWGRDPHTLFVGQGTPQMTSVLRVGTPKLHPSVRLGPPYHLNGAGDPQIVPLCWDPTSFSGGSGLPRGVDLWGRDPHTLCGAGDPPNDVCLEGWDPQIAPIRAVGTPISPQWGWGPPRLPLSVGLGPHILFWGLETPKWCQSLGSGPPHPLCRAEDPHIPSIHGIGSLGAALTSHPI